MRTPTIQKTIVQHINKLFSAEKGVAPLLGSGVLFVIKDDEVMLKRSFGPCPSDHPSTELDTSSARVKADESLIPLHISVLPEWTNLGIGILRDESERERYEKTDALFLHSIIMGLEHIVMIEMERYKNVTLLELMKSLHASHSVDDILNLVHVTINEVYPQLKLTIWLSHDYETDQHVKILHFPSNLTRFSELSKNHEVYMSGETLIYECADSGCEAISAPIMGNQGIYGVLQLQSSVQGNVLRDEIEQVKRIADMIGIALENANLYSQSNRLIKDLQLINDMSQQLSKTLNVDKNTDFMMSKLTETFRAETIQFLLYLKGKSEFKVMASNVPLDSDYVHVDESAIIKAVYQSKESYISSMVTIDDHKDIALTKLHVKQMSSLMIVPMIQDGKVEGMILLSHSQQNYYNYDDFRLLQTMVYHATLALVNSSLHQEMNRMVITDNLTRLYSRAHLDEQVGLSQLKDLKGSFILLDIDNFKKVNDTFGHQVGDDVLIQVANILKASIREGDIAARWGGEELALYLPNVPLEIAVKIAERVRERVGRETSPTVTISCGVSYWQQQNDHKSMKLLFNDADEALYEAKAGGKNRVVINQKIKSS